MMGDECGRREWAGHKPWATAAYEASTALGVKVGRLACRAAQPLCPSTLPLSAISSGSQLAPPPAGQLSQQIAAKSKVSLFLPC